MGPPSALAALAPPAGPAAAAAGLSSEGTRPVATSSCGCRRLRVFLAYLALTPAAPAPSIAPSSASSVATTCAQTEIRAQVERMGAINLLV